MVESGKVSGFHGLRGEVKIRSLSGNLEPLLQAERLQLRLTTGQQLEVEVCSCRGHKGQVLARLRGYDSLTAVEHLRGAEVWLAPDALPELAGDEFYWHQVEGALVVDRQCGRLGKLQSMYTTAAHDIWVVESSTARIEIPVVEAFVVNIDHEAGQIEVDLPEGLLDMH